MKLLEKRREEIQGYPRQTFQFGATPRHKVCSLYQVLSTVMLIFSLLTQLDIYYPDPKAVPTKGPQPVLFFVYGGAFIEGDRQIAKPYDLGYANLGVFFAQRGYAFRPSAYSTYLTIRLRTTAYLQSSPTIASGPK